MRRLFLIFVFLLIACPAWGAKGPYTTYYVAQTASGDGTGVDQSNYMSVAAHNAKASAYFAGDDTLYLCGSLTSAIVPTGSGTSGHLLTYSGACPGNAGTVNVTGGISFNGQNMSYIKIQYLTVVSDSTHNAIQFSSGTGVQIMYCNSTGQMALYLINLTSPVVTGNTLTGISAVSAFPTMLLILKTSATITDNTITATGASLGLSYIGASPAPIIISQNNTVNGNASAVDIDQYACKFSYISGMSVSSTDDTCSNSGAIGLYITGASTYTDAVVNIRGISIGGNRLSGIYAGVNSTYASFILTKSLTRNWSVYNTSAGAGVHLSYVNGAEISYGDVYGNSNNGISLFRSTSVKVHHIHAYNNLNDGISLGNSTSANAVTNSKFYLNHVYSNGADVATAGDGFTSHAGCTGNTYSYNLVHNNVASCHAHVLDATAYIYNDTCINNGRADYSLYGIKGCLFQSGTGGWTVKNTICSGSYPYEVNFTSSAYAASTFDNNLYYHAIGDNGISDGNGFTVDAKANSHDWTWYHTTSGYEPNSQLSDPLFISATNFHLQSGSPARGAGVNVGLSRTNPPDIGAEPYQQYVPWKH
jgi:hypothetical protein